MNNNALVITGIVGDKLPEIISFIESQTKGQKGEEHEILGTFPILFLHSENVLIDKELIGYASDELTFIDGSNYAGQDFIEILELLDTTDIFICGDQNSTSYSKVCQKLNESGFSIHTL